MAIGPYRPRGGAAGTLQPPALTTGRAPTAKMRTTKTGGSASPAARHQAPKAGHFPNPTGQRGGR